MRRALKCGSGFVPDSSNVARRVSGGTNAIRLRGGPRRGARTAAFELCGFSRSVDFWIQAVGSALAPTS